MCACKSKSGEQITVIHERYFTERMEYVAATVCINIWKKWGIIWLCACFPSQEINSQTVSADLWGGDLDFQRLLWWWTPHTAPVLFLPVGRCYEIHLQTNVPLEIILEKMCCRQTQGASDRTAKLTIYCFSIWECCSMLPFFYCSCHNLHQRIKQITPVALLTFTTHCVLSFPSSAFKCHWNVQFSAAHVETLSEFWRKALWSEREKKKFSDDKECVWGSKAKLSTRKQPIQLSSGGRSSSSRGALVTLTYLVISGNLCPLKLAVINQENTRSPHF